MCNPWKVNFSDVIVSNIDDNDEDDDDNDDEGNY